MIFLHFICYLYEGQNKIKKFCFQGCQSRIFCTTYIEGEQKILVKKGLGISQKSKIKFAVCGCTRFACYSVRMAGKTKLIIRTVFTAVFFASWFNRTNNCKFTNKKAEIMICGEKGDALKIRNKRKFSYSIEKVKAV